MLQDQPNGRLLAIALFLNLKININADNTKNIKDKERGVINE